MPFIRLASIAVVFYLALALCSPAYNARPFDQHLARRQSSTGTYSSAPVVDLGYERYQGFSNVTLGLNIFQGIRYAAPPTGSRRWQAPLAPLVNRDQVLSANALPPRCPQSQTSPATPGYNFTGDEDCLFLNVYAPQGKTNLPVLVYIHGGGYCAGQANNDLSMIVNTNNNSFIGVTIQYRLGAFGFLSSDEVNRYGIVNAGIRDQTFAMQWIQSYISLFGGNASQVTISGESAGGSSALILCPSIVIAKRHLLAGSVMLQALAFGGNLGESLFSNVLTSSKGYSFVY
ncbi:MAG: hypothetical protein Q9218_007135 [Villophora microphyllina]